MASPALSDRPRLTERRFDARLPLTRPVKLRCTATGRYYSGRTGDVSAGGALLMIDHPSLLVAGQRLEVGVAWSRADAVLPSESLLDATVVRSLAHGGSQRVAVRFAQRQRLAAAG